MHGLNARKLKLLTLIIPLTLLGFDWPVSAGTCDLETYYANSALGPRQTVIALGERLKERRERREEKKADERAAKKDGDPCAKGDQSSPPCVSWISPIVKPRVALLCIHGLGLNSNSYTTFGKRMSRMGVATYAIDVRGFGSWMNAQGHGDVDFDGCLCDIKRTLQSIRAANPGLPVILLGESMGGAIAMRACALYPELVDGLISSVPAGERFEQRKTSFKVALQFLTGPNRQRSINRMVVNQATDNPALREDWEGDPLNRLKLSPKELWQFQNFMNDNHDAAKKIEKTPVLVMQGTLDQLVKPEGTWELFNDIKTTSKTFIALPSEHLIFEEGQAKSAKFDSRVAHVTAGWIANFVPGLDDNETLADPLAPARIATAVQNVANTITNGGGQPAASANPDLHQAIALIEGGRFEDALGLLTAAVQQAPDSPEAHYWLGVDLNKMHRPVQARRELMQALRLSRGKGRAREANDALLGMPTEQGDQPQTGTTGPTSGGLTQGLPTAVTFCAAWAEQCKDMDNIFSQAKAMFGDRVKLVRIDVDDPANDAIVKTYSVGPVPTTIFLKPDGSVASTLIGRCSFLNFAQGIRGLFPDAPRLPGI